jgi:hypothetical protein
MCVSALKPAEVAAVQADAGDEEAHRLRRSAALAALLRRQHRSRHDRGSGGKYEYSSPHRSISL